MAYSARNFVKWPYIAKSSFSDSQEISKSRVVNGTESNGLNLFSQIKEIMKQG